MMFDATFTEKCSGSDTNRLQLKAMLAHLRKGDTVAVHEISRLARNTADLLALVEQLTGKRVPIEFEKEDTFAGEKANPMNQMPLTMLGAVAALELSMINERRAEGPAKARAEGRHIGRSAKLSIERAAELCSRTASGESNPPSPKSSVSAVPRCTPRSKQRPDSSCPDQLPLICHIPLRRLQLQCRPGPGLSRLIATTHRRHHEIDT